MYLDTQEHPSAASIQPQRAEFPTMLGSLGYCLQKPLADYGSVDSRNSMWETGANLDRKTVDSTLFRSESKGKREIEIKLCNRQERERERKSPQYP